MILIAELLLVAVNILMAAYHADLIKRGKTPYHGWWGAGYLAIAIVFSRYNHSWLLFVCSLLIRKVVFDLTLNLMRDLPLFYVSSSTTSILDRWHNKIFGKKSEIYMAIYTGILVVLNIFM